jgi:DNA-binding NarL/FixJ family response regulator
VRLFVLRHENGGREPLLPRGCAVSVVGDDPWSPAALGTVALLRPDVLLLDLRNAGDELAAIVRGARAASAEARVVVLEPPSDSEELARDAIIAGASGYLSRDVSPAAVLHAVARVAEGTMHYTSTAMRAVKALLADPNDRRRR